MGWSLVFVAAAIEVAWASTLKYAQSFLDWSIIGLLIAISFILLIQSYKRLPVAMAYSVFVGIGTVGTYLVGLFLGEAFNLNQIFFLIILLGGIAGLKMTTKEEEVDV